MILKVENSVGVSTVENKLIIIVKSTEFQFVLLTVKTKAWMISKWLINLLVMKLDQPIYLKTMSPESVDFLSNI